MLAQIVPCEAAPLLALPFSPVPNLFRISSSWTLYRCVLSDLYIIFIVIFLFPFLSEHLFSYLCLFLRYMAGFYILPLHAKKYQKFMFAGGRFFFSFSGLISS